MNQALQFLDDEVDDPKTQAVFFSALQAGFKLTCAISYLDIHRYFGPGSPLEQFKKNRWEIEESAERVIKEQLDDESGCYWVSSI